jgi:hypothetical protein
MEKTSEGWLGSIWRRRGAHSRFCLANLCCIYFAFC